VTETNSRILLDRYQRLAEISLDLASTLDLQVLLNRIVLYFPVKFLLPPPMARKPL
jgi:hypothetical protein